MRYSNNQRCYKSSRAFLSESACINLYETDNMAPWTAGRTKKLAICVNECVPCRSGALFVLCVKCAIHRRRRLRRRRRSAIQRLQTQPQSSAPGAPKSNPLKNFAIFFTKCKNMWHKVLHTSYYSQTWKVSLRLRQNRRKYAALSHGDLAAVTLSTRSSADADKPARRT